MVSSTTTDPDGIPPGERSVRRVTSKPCAVTILAGLVEPLRMTRRHDQDRILSGLSNAGERAEDRLLFPTERAGSDQDRSIHRELEVSERAVSHMEVGARGRYAQSVELETAGDGQSLGWEPKIDEAAAPELGLRAHAVEILQDASHERPSEAIPAVRALRHPPVDQDRLDASPPTRAQQVRPDLGIDQDEEVGRPRGRGHA